MSQTKFTASVIAKLECDPEKKQTIFYDSKTPGLGLRVTSTGLKSYVFESRLHGKTIRMTIGSTQTWPLGEAQTEAAKLRVLIDRGEDPRQMEQEKKTAAEVRRQRERMERVTIGEVWEEYVNKRKPLWSARHYHDHMAVMHAGGSVRSRSNVLTVPGVLASLVNTRLADLTNDKVEQWARVESLKRPTQARLALRLLKAFLNWCAEHTAYRIIVLGNTASNKSIREVIGKPNVKNDVLQREQLPTWFKAVKQIQNPVISAYLQTLLITGARREELAHLRWDDADFQWNSLTIRDKVDGQRTIPLTPYVSFLLNSLPRRNQWVFSSPTAASGRLIEPNKQHRKVCSIIGIDISLHGLRRSFASLSEWIEIPAGIAAQIQGHKPQGVREQNYIRRPLDLLRVGHTKIESWILEQAGIEFEPAQAGLHAVKT